MTRALSGEDPGTASAEGTGLRVLAQVGQGFILDEGPLFSHVRLFVSQLMKKDDPLRRDIPPELWAALWPTLNTLWIAREKYVQTIEDAADPQPQPDPGPGGLGILESDSQAGEPIQ